MERPTGPLLENFSLHTLTLASDLPEALSCPVCMNALLDPVQCKNGHLLCRLCANLCLAKDSVCPSCRVAMRVDDLTRPAAIIRDMLEALVVQCPHSGHAEQKKRKLEAKVTSCNWTGPLKYLGEHLKIDCKLTLVQCECKEILAISRMAVHLEEECSQRSMLCVFCRADFKVALLKSHEIICDKSPHVIVLCICGQNVARGDIGDHMEKKGGHLQLLMTGLQALQSENVKLKSRLENVHPEPFVEANLFVPAEKITDWRSPPISFGGMSFCVRLASDGVYLYSLPSAHASKGFWEMCVEMFVDEKEFLPEGNRFRSDGTALGKDGKWKHTGWGKNFDLPLAVDGYHCLHIKLIQLIQESE